MTFFREKRTGDPKWMAGDEEHDAALAEFGVAVEAASRIRAEPTRWLVQDVVPDEAVTIIGGASGAGKTFFACQLAADVARQLRGRVVFATTGYERPELLRWRLDQAEGDARRVAIAALTPKGFTDRRNKPSEDEIDERLSILYHTLAATADPTSGILPQLSVASSPLSAGTDGDPGSNGPRTTDNGPQSVRLLVIDDVDGWFGQPGNMLSAAALARVIQRLDELARCKRVAIVVLVRVQLSVEGRITARQLSRIAHAASVVWTVARDREGAREGRRDGATERGSEGEMDAGGEGETERGTDGETMRHGDTESKNLKSKIQNPKSRRWLMPVKNNLAEDGAAPGLAFELVEGRIRWRKEPVPELAEVLLPSVHNNDRRRLRRAACEWLQEALAGGPVPSGEVIKQALSCGISRGTLTRAITDLGIKSHKTGFNGGWEMRWTPALEPRRPAAWSGLRVVIAGDETCGQGDTETRGHGEGETERWREGSGQWTVDSEQRADVTANRASSRKCEEIDATSCRSSKAADADVAGSPDLATAATEGPQPVKPVEGDLRSNGCQGRETPTERECASCASSEKHGDSSRVSCASSEVENADVARSPDLATAATEGPQAVKPVEGDLRSNGCQGRETLTERECASCASSEKHEDSSRANCASSNESGPETAAGRNPNSKIENPKSAARPHPGPAYPLADTEGDGQTERASAGAMKERVENQTPKTQDLRPKTSESNPNSKIENPKSEEEPMPHWMQRWYKQAGDRAKKAC